MHAAYRGLGPRRSGWVMSDGNMAILTEGPVGRTLVRLTGPMILGIGAMVAFNLTDTFFVGRLGPTELAALSFTFPIVLIVNSIAIGIGIGASAVISRAIGRGENDEVRRLSTDSLTLAVSIVAVFIVIGFLTIDPIFRRLGATDNVLPFIRQYMRIWYMGMIFVVVPMVGNNAIRARGDTKRPAAVMLVAVMVNVIMDPLLIFGIGPFPRLGVAGAATATVLARASAFLAALYILNFKYRMLTLERCGFGRVLDSWRRILYIGVPTAGSRIIIPIAIGVITRIVSSYGEKAVAGYGVASRVEFFALAVVFALSSVIGPLVGQNLGAGLHDRVNRGIRLGNRFSILWGLGMLAMLAPLARWIASLFNEDPVIIESASLYLRIVPVGYALQGVFVVSTATMNVLKKPFHAVGMTILEMFVLIIPLALLGSSLLGLRGVYGAIPIAYTITGIASCLLLGRFLVAAESDGSGKAC
jgi:putative MATE family efflux protein